MGLAVARELAIAGREVLVVDKAADIGSETSSRNSEVIHAGIYYPAGTLKARLCVEGRQLLYDFCAARGVEAPAIGKLIVATTPAEITKLQQLAEAARLNGVTDLQWLTREEAIALEPEVSCVAALLSPSTGIVDSHGYMLALQGDAEAHGAGIVLRTSFQSARRDGAGHIAVLADDRSETSELHCRTIVNCAGHGAHGIAASIEGVDATALPPRHLAKGSYCAVSGRSPFTRLIYPIPVPGALGTHVTMDLDGRARLGPNIEWVQSLDYSVADSIVSEFREACRRFWPGIGSRDITPSYAGIRPKVHGPDSSFADFIIEGAAQNALAGIVNLFGIESPGLTSSLAIARHVARMMGVFDSHQGPQPQNLQY